MRTAIENCSLVTGDGKTHIEKALILVEGRTIGYCGKQRDFERNMYEVLDASGRIALPGIVNAHAHGILPDVPLFSSGSQGLKMDEAMENAQKHLSEGTTSILNADGFANPLSALFFRDSAHANIMTAVARSPKSCEAAALIDGQGIQAYRAEEEFFDKIFASASHDERNSVVAAVGECGSGATLGGGVQDYKFIPEMIMDKYGVKISEAQARALKEAVLGRHIDAGAYSAGAVKKTALDLGIDAAPGDLKKDITGCVMPPFQKALEAIAEEYENGKELRLPVIVHSAAASMDALERITANGADYMIAGHSNHPSFEFEEGLEFAGMLKDRGAVIDISTFDTLNTGNRQEMEYFKAFIQLGLADIVSTDYGGGNHCSILSMLGTAVRDGVVSLPGAIRLATSNPARAVPVLGQNKGLLAEGYDADIILVGKDDISDVGYVMIEGKKRLAKE